MSENIGNIHKSKLEEIKKFVQANQLLIAFRPVNKETVNLISIYGNQVVGKDLTVKQKSAEIPPIGGFIPVCEYLNKGFYNSKGKTKKNDCSELFKLSPEQKERTNNYLNSSENEIKNKKSEFKIKISNNSECRLYYKLNNENEPQKISPDSDDLFCVEMDGKFYKYSDFENTNGIHTLKPDVKDIKLDEQDLKSVEVFSRDGKYCIADYDMFIISENDIQSKIQKKDKIGFVSDEIGGHIDALKKETDGMILHGSESLNEHYTELITDQTNGEPYTFIYFNNKTNNVETKTCNTEQEIIKTLNNLKNKYGYKFRINPNWGFKQTVNGNYEINQNRVFLKEIEFIIDDINLKIKSMNLINNSEIPLLKENDIKDQYIKFNKDSNNINKNFLTTILIDELKNNNIDLTLLNETCTNINLSKKSEGLETFIAELKQKTSLNQQNQIKQNDKIKEQGQQSWRERLSQSETKNTTEYIPTV